MANSWEQFYKEGNDFYNALQRALRCPAVYTPELVHNIAGMSIEKYCMAILMFHNRMPYNHTLGELIDSVSGVTSVDPALVNMLTAMDSLQEICAMDAYIPKRMNDDDKNLFTDAASRVRAMAIQLTGGAENVVGKN